MTKEIVMYVRRFYCPNVALARDVLKRYHLPYREIDIDQDPEMTARVKAWTHYYSVPTITWLLLKRFSQDLFEHLIVLVCTLGYELAVPHEVDHVLAGDLLRVERMEA